MIDDASGCTMVECRFRKSITLSDYGIIVITMESGEPEKSP